MGWGAAKEEVMGVVTLPRSRAPYNVALDDDEWRFIRSLREIPPSPLRDRMSGLIDDVLSFVANPGCPEMQADGVPCTDAQMACDRCRKLLDLMQELRHRLHHA
jgi:hypothetical protein